MPGSQEPYHLRLLREHLEGRRIIVALDVLVAGADLAARLAELGVAEVLLIAGSRGTGHLDDEVERDAMLLGTSADDLMGAIRAFESALDDPPQPVRDVIEAFDPGREALVVTTMFSGRQQLCGRPVLGARAPAWRALEDKTRVDALWDAAGVPRAASRIVPARRGELMSAAAELDEGLGTVWVADNREGWHGGAAGLRWVRPDDDGAAAATDLARMADRVRVMPFLDGMPCSIHGWVLGDEVLATRPCEAVLWREVGASRLWYGGAAATTWRPDAASVAEMRELVRRVGHHLRETVGYRGVFTVDGVLTAEGFRPSELNPRFGAAIAALGRGAELPLYLVHCLSIARPDLNYRVAELEDVLLNGEASAAAHLLLDGVEATPRTLRVVRAIDERLAVEDVPIEDGPVEPATEGAGHETAVEVAHVELGPSPTGAFLRIALSDHPDGAPVAPAAAELLPVVAHHLGIQLPALAPAPDLRPA